MSKTQENTKSGCFQPACQGCEVVLTPYLESRKGINLNYAETHIQRCLEDRQANTPIPCRLCKLGLLLFAGFKRGDQNTKFSGEYYNYFKYC